MSNREPPLTLIPQLLRDRDQWVCWRLQLNSGRMTKVPYSPRSGNRSSVNDPTSWTSVKLAQKAWLDNDVDGIGFVFTETDPFAGIDLDGCRDPDTGAVHPSAQSIIDRLHSYTEISPSGSGLHIYVMGTLPPTGRSTGKVPWRGDGTKKTGFEVYDSGRFFTFTGRHLEGTPLTIEERQDELTALHTEYFPRRKPPRQSARALNVSDSEIIERAKRAKNGDAFGRLWNGDTTGYESPSEADLALCSMLAFWTGGDAERIDGLFRQSDLVRSKWDASRGSRTYGERTISKAIEL